MEYAAGELCPVCESGKLEEVVKNLEFEYKSRKSIVENVTCFECPICEDYLTNRKESRRIEKYLTDERRREDGLLVSDEIKDIRKQFGLTQTQFAQKLGVGIKNFARYESGQSAQSVTMNNLLRVFQKHHETFSVFDEYWSTDENSLSFQVSIPLPMIKKVTTTISGLLNGFSCVPDRNTT